MYGMVLSYTEIKKEETYCGHVVSLENYGNYKTCVVNFKGKIGIKGIDVSDNAFYTTKKGDYVCFELNSSEIGVDKLLYEILSGISAAVVVGSILGIIFFIDYLKTIKKHFE